MEQAIKKDRAREHDTYLFCESGARIGSNVKKSKERSAVHSD